MESGRCEMTLSEIAIKDRAAVEKIENRRREQMIKLVQELLPEDEVTVTGINKRESGYEEFYYVEYNFTLDGYTQNESNMWGWDESQAAVAEKIVDRISYIKELREKYPEYCKANDYLQNNRVFERSIEVDGEYNPEHFTLSVTLASMLKLPNQTACGVGGGDYEVRRVPKNVRRFNANIDKTVDALLECITDLRKLKMQELTSKTEEKQNV
jgi:hypothetical protein